MEQIVPVQRIVEKYVDVPQLQIIDEVDEVPVQKQVQVPIITKVQTLVEDDEDRGEDDPGPRAQYVGRWVDLCLRMKAMKDMKARQTNHGNQQTEARKAMGALLMQAALQQRTSRSPSTPRCSTPAADYASATYADYAAVFPAVYDRDVARTTSRLATPLPPSLPPLPPPSP